MRFFRIVVLVFAACWCSEAPVVGVCAGLGLVCPAEAAAVVGTASKIKQTVTGGFDYGLARPMSDNDEVILNETVRTDASGEARLTLGEGTNLIVFAHSSIKVARFTPSNVVMTTADGTFAVSTGSPRSRQLSHRHRGRHVDPAWDQIYLQRVRRTSEARRAGGGGHALPARQGQSLLRGCGAGAFRGRAGRSCAASPRLCRTARAATPDAAGRTPHARSRQIILARRRYSATVNWRVRRRGSTR